jgi:LysM repeat protein
MLLMKKIQIQRLALIIAMSCAVTACSWLPFRKSSPPPAASVEPVSEPATTTAGPDESEMTATEAAVSGAAMPAYSTPAEGEGNALINPTAPKNYTVKRGDTLWGIASLFLRDPWLWPEVWYVNPQVDNPHLIYPGDMLALAYGADGTPQIRLERGGAARLNPRLRSSALDGAIPVLPYGDIAAFLSRPSVLAEEDIKSAPYVLAFRDGHVLAGEGHDIYVRKLQANANSRHSVIHVGDPIRDPDDEDIIGYQGIYVSTALVTAAGDPAKATLTDSVRETLEGDKLFTTDIDIPLNFVPSAPKKAVEGRIISVVDGVELIGQYQIVVINRGTSHGIDIGNVLAIDQAGETVPDRHSERSGLGRLSTSSVFAPKVKLPNERAGLMLVFKTFDRVSYGLIVGAANPIRVLDVVRTP